MNIDLLKLDELIDKLEKLIKENGGDDNDNAK